MNYENLTEKEKLLVGKIVICTKRLNYGHNQISTGNKGVIVDFGSQSHEPLIAWNDGFESFEGFAPWESIRII